MKLMDKPLFVTTIGECGVALQRVNSLFEVLLIIGLEQTCIGFTNEDEDEDGDELGSRMGFEVERIFFAISLSNLSLYFIFLFCWYFWTAKFKDTAILIEPSEDKVAGLCNLIQSFFRS